MARPNKGVTFWDRVESKKIVDENDCHIFTGHKDECGYGRIHRDGKLVRIHREVWKLHNGEIPERHVICHRCDVPACINPKHLFVGIQADNVHDMWNKGRQNILSGERNGSSKLMASDIPVIRDRINAGETCYSIARDYGVKGETILHIKHKRSWCSA